MAGRRGHRVRISGHLGIWAPGHLIDPHQPRRLGDEETNTNNTTRISRGIPRHGIYGRTDTTDTTDTIDTIDRTDRILETGYPGSPHGHIPDAAWPTRADGRELERSRGGMVTLTRRVYDSITICIDVDVV